jgi:hypothetical protein
LALIDLGTDQDHALARMRSPGIIARHRDLDRPGSATWLMLHRLGIPRFWGMRPKLLSSCSLILLALIAVLGFSLGRGGDSWLATWGGALIGLAAGQTRNLKMPDPAGP